MEIVIGTATKPSLSGIMLPNIKSGKNQWSNFSKSKGRGDKICYSKLNSRYQIYQFTLILYGVAVRCDVDIFKLTASAQSIYREIYGEGH